MADRIIFTAIPSRPDVARVCADECRIKLTDLSTATLRTDQITVRTMYKMLSKNAQRDTGRISFDTFHALMDDVFRNNARSSGGGKTYQFRRVVQKLYRAADSDSKMSLTPVELMCGMSLLCRPEAGISGVDIDSTTPIVEDCLRIMCPDGNVTYERLNAYFTILFSIFISMSPDLSKICTPSTEGEGDNGQHARELSKRFCDEAFRQIVGDTTSSTISIYKFSSWFRGAAIPPQVDRTTAIQIKRRLAGIEDEKDIPVVVRNETVSTKNSIKQWVDYDVSPAKCTPHVLAPSKCHTSAPFGLDDQPPTKEPLAFDRVYDTRFDGKDTESHVVLGSYGTDKLDETPVPKKKMLPPNSPQEVKHMRNEMYRAVRDYVRGAISSRSLRNRLAVLNISLSHDAERLLSRSERNGSCSFREIVTCLEPCIPESVFKPPEPKSVGSETYKPVGILRDRHGHGDVLAWRNENKETPPPIPHRRNSKDHVEKLHALKSSTGLLSWPDERQNNEEEEDRASQHSTSSSVVQHPWTRDEAQPARGRMHVSPSRHRTAGCPFGTSQDEKVRVRKHVRGRRRYSNAPGFTDHVGQVITNAPASSSRPQLRVVRRDQRSHLGSAAATTMYPSPHPRRGVRKFGRGHVADAWTDHLVGKDRIQ